MSSLLYNLYAEKIMPELSYISEGIEVIGHIISNIRYADDTVLIANSEEGLKVLVNKFNEASVNAGLSVNVKKTVCVVFNKGHILNK